MATEVRRQFYEKKEIACNINTVTNKLDNASYD
jgi:hypothetical protein